MDDFVYADGASPTARPTTATTSCSRPAVLRVGVTPCEVVVDVTPHADAHVRLAPGVQPGGQLRRGERGAGARRDHARALHAHRHVRRRPAVDRRCSTASPFAVPVTAGETLTADRAGARRRRSTPSSTRFHGEARSGRPGRRSSSPAATAFYADFGITPGTDGHGRGHDARTAQRRSSSAATRRAARSGRSVSTESTMPTTVEFRDDLATIARKLADLLRVSSLVHTYDVVVVGRTLTITRDDDATPTASFVDHAGNRARRDTSAPRSAHSSSSRRRTGTSRADRHVVGRRRRARRRRRRARLPGLRGSRQPHPRPADHRRRPAHARRAVPHQPAAAAGRDEPADPDGPADRRRAADRRRRRRSPTSNASHVNAQYGERPGFDPRMNDFPYTVSFLSGAANGRVARRRRRSPRDILSVGSATAFAVGAITRTAAAPPASSSSAARPTRREPRLVSLDEGGRRAHRPHAHRRDVAAARSAATTVSYTVQPGDEVPSRVAQRLATQIQALTGYTVEVRIGLLGDSRLIITQRDAVHRRLADHRLADGADERPRDVSGVAGRRLDHERAVDDGSVAVPRRRGRRARTGRSRSAATTFTASTVRRRSRRVAS